MNKLIKVLLLMPVLLMLAACSNNDEPEALLSGTTETTKGISSFADLSELYQPIHTELLAKLLTGKASITYGLSGWNFYESYPKDNGRFLYFDHTGYYGFEISAPRQIVFSEGHVWAPLSTFSIVTGPTRLGMAWAAYQTASGDISSIYIGHDFAFNESDRRVRFLGRNFTMMMFNRNNFSLAELTGVKGDIDSPYDHQTYEFFEYERIADSAMLEPGAIGFASNEEAAAYIIAKCREFFGDVIDLNKVYAPNAIFDNPNIDLDELERYVASGADRGAY